MKLIWMVLCLTLTAQASFQVDDLKKLVEENKITTIDQLIPLLPKNILMNPLMVYQSHALHLDRVSSESPRVILFNEDASLVMAFTQNPGQDLIAQGTDALEVIEFNKVSNKFEMKEFVFDGSETPFKKPISVNPAVCLSCHGANPRPIFNDYNSWPGFYGSFGTRGYAVQGTQEFKFFEKFLDQRQQTPRYKDLDLDGIQKDEVGYRTTSRGFGPLHDEFKFSINMAFGAKIESLMWKRLAGKLSNDSNFEKLKPLFYALGEETNRCGPIRKTITNLASIVKATDEPNALVLQEKIGRQINLDHQAVVDTILEFNAVDGILDKEADSRGIVNIPYINWNKIGFVPDDPNIDKQAFSDLLLLMESTFSKLEYSSSDLSTTPGYPTRGIFHLSRLGRLLIDEQFFQNLMREISFVSPDFKNRFDQLDCIEIQKQAVAATGLLVVPNTNNAGVLYK